MLYFSKQNFNSISRVTDIRIFRSSFSTRIGKRIGDIATTVVALCHRSQEEKKELSK